MDTLRVCQRCQKPVPPNAPEGLCPECLARVALGSEPAGPGTRVPPAPAALAAQFPQLEILELLGMGGMGMVYKARQPRLDRLVALKILPIASMPDASFGERFEREAKALARLNHPGIVTLYDFGQTQGYYYFIMEFVDGMNLRQLIQAKTLEPRQALELVTQICTALQFAHDEKIVHRDIKPENILITKKGRVKIADFGLAKLLGSQPDTALTASQMVMGTMNYMAPEQRENTKDVDHRADIYSLGVVFYEMLTGEVPMGRFDAPSKKVQIDVRLDEVVLHALEREPARRYQHVSEVKTSVETITDSTPKPSATKPVVSRDDFFQKLNINRKLLPLTLAILVVTLFVPSLVFSRLRISPAISTTICIVVFIYGVIGFAIGYFKLRGTKEALRIKFLSLLALAWALLVCGLLTKPFIDWVHRHSESRPGNHDAFLIYLLLVGLFVWAVSAMAKMWREHFAKELNNPPTASVPAAPIGLRFEISMAIVGIIAVIAGITIVQGIVVAARLWKTSSNAVQFGRTPISLPLASGWTNSLGMVFVPVKGTSTAFSIWDTRVQDFAAFANGTGYQTEWSWSWRHAEGTNSGGHWIWRWNNPELAPGPLYPVSGMSWNNAHAFCRWLTEKEHKSGLLKPELAYRLPTEQEWSVVFGSAQYPWGDQWPPPNETGNYAGVEAMDETWPFDWPTIPGYHDDYVRSSPVGIFPPNWCGLYDVSGNVWQWSEDLHGTNHSEGFLRGGSWSSGATNELQSSYRKTAGIGNAYETHGFRCVISRISTSEPGATHPVALKFVRVDCESDSSEKHGVNAVDGNPHTFWETQWHIGHPHEIIVELVPPSSIKGFTYLPREGDDNGAIKDYEFYVSNDGENFGTPVSKGSFEYDRGMKSALFQPIKCRFIKLRALSEIGGGPATSVAELGIIQSTDDAP
jgi:predicted Ser/Thr protein kinase